MVLVVKFCNYMRRVIRVAKWSVRDLSRSVECRVRSSERSCAFAMLSKLFGGTVQAVAAFSDCVVLELWLRAQTRSSSCLAAGVQFGWCRQSWLVALLAVAVNSDCLDFG